MHVPTITPKCMNGRESTRYPISIAHILVSLSSKQIRAILDLQKLTLSLDETWKHLRTLEMFLMISWVPSPTNITMSAYKTCEIKGRLFGSLMPINMDFEHTVFMVIFITSIAMIKRKREKGSPWQTPFDITRSLSQMKTPLNPLSSYNPKPHPLHD